MKELINISFDKTFEASLERFLHENILNTIGYIKEANKPNQWVKKTECAKQFGVSFTTFQKWIVEEGCPTHEVNGLILCNINEVNDWLKNK